MPLFGPPNVEKLEKKGRVRALIRALRYEKDLKVRLDAAKALGNLGDVRSVEPLIRLLEDPDDDVREEAARALSRLGGERAVAPLIALLEDDNADVQREAASALGRIGGPAVPLLIERLQDADGEQRRRAAKILGWIRDPSASAGLIKALRDEDRTVAAEAATALDKVDWQPDEGEAGIWYWINKLLLHHEYEVTRKAMRSLGRIGGARVVNPLIVMVGDETIHPQGREHVADVLGEIGDPRGVEALIAALKDDAWEVRTSAPRALGKIGDSAAVKPLATALEDADSRVRSNAAEALGKIGDPLAFDPLLEAAGRGRCPTAIKALAGLDKAQALSASKKQLLLQQVDGLSDLYSHVDRSSHWDLAATTCFGHEDKQISHTDRHRDFHSLFEE